MGGFEVGLDVGSGGAIVAGEEFVDEFLAIEVGVPEEFGEDPGFEFGQFGAFGGVGALLEDALDGVVDEELDIGRQDTEVGVGAEVVPEVGDVVPDVESVRDFGPADDIVAEFLVAGVFEGLAE